MFYKPDGTRYDLILGSNLQKVIVLYILNCALAFLCYEVQVHMVYMKYQDNKIIDNYHWNRNIGEPGEFCS